MSPSPVLDPATQWIVVDTDPGLDDAHALQYLLTQPDVEILGLTIIYGNTGVEDAARNAAVVLDRASRSDIPIYLGAAAPLEGDPKLAWFVHGHDGLGDRFERPELRVEAESAADYLVRIANTYPGQVDLHPIGPLTNIALALQQDPDLFLKFRSVVIMGGVGPYPTAGSTNVGDANTHNDRAAAEIVYGARNNGNVVMVGVNVTMQALLEEHVYNLLVAVDTPWSRFSAEVLDAYNEFYQHNWGRRISSAHDGLASVVLHRPEIVTSWLEGPVTVTERAGARVELTANGLPVVFGTPEGPAIRAVTAFDLADFQRRFVHSLAYGSTRGALDTADRVPPQGWFNGRAAGERGSE